MGIHRRKTEATAVFVAAAFCQCPKANLKVQPLPIARWKAQLGCVTFEALPEFGGGRSPSCVRTPRLEHRLFLPAIATPHDCSMLGQEYRERDALSS